ncbi:hypothetical protein E2C01_092105 [Portunus trituberculatus]|uniref:Uncharacterized protein n=1 Tax=Portunus trituberculatus TaxID=210409 RepID=A0A5B7JR58_PORTR|nr:hypothetical protein [Portunus trituberculatus]
MKQKRRGGGVPKQYHEARFVSDAVNEAQSEASSMTRFHIHSGDYLVILYSFKNSSIVKTGY